MAKAIERTVKPQEDGSYKICRDTARVWMKRAGALRGWYKPGYYTDVHEREDVILDRIEYLKLNRHLAWRTALWVVMTPVGPSKSCPGPRFTRRIIHIFCDSHSYVRSALDA